MGIEDLVLQSGFTLMDFTWLIIILVELIIAIVLYVLLERTARWAIDNTEYRFSIQKKTKKSKTVKNKKLKKR